jgi:hypothetical protein
LAANVLEGYTGARYSDTVLFIDARHIYRQIDRAHRDWTDAQIGFLTPGNFFDGGGFKDKGDKEKSKPPPHLRPAAAAASVL